MSHSPAFALGLPGNTGRAVWDPRWLLPLLCTAVGLALALGNPNYRWSERRDNPYGADVLQEWVAGDMLLQGAAASIYDPLAFARWQHDPQRVGFEWPESELYPAVYPPPYYCLVAPLAALPYRAAVFVWLTLLLAAYPLALWLAERRPWPVNLPCATPSNRNQVFWCVALFFPALFMGLVMGQKGTLWLLVVVASWQLWRADKSFAAGCVWALLTVKPTLCWLLPIVMLVNRQWRFCGGVLVGTAGLWGATSLVVPVALWNDFGQVVLGSGSYQEHAGYREGWSASLLTLLAACGLPRPWALGLWAVSGAVMVLSLVALPRSRSVRERLEAPEFLLRVLVATALLSPHFYFYDLVWLIFPLGGLFRSSPRRALSYSVALWLGLLVAQQLETAWPIPALVLLGVWGHATLVLMPGLLAGAPDRSARALRSPN